MEACGVAKFDDEYPVSPVYTKTFGYLKTR